MVLLPLDALVGAANAVLNREGRTLATYGLNSGPQGYRPLREFLAAKLERAAGIACTADEILIVSGSLQALDLVNGILLTRGDTVIIEQDTYQGALTRLARLGVRAVGIPLDRDGMRMDAFAAALAELKRGSVRPKYIYTVPTVQNPTGTILSQARRLDTLMDALNEQFGTAAEFDDPRGGIFLWVKLPDVVDTQRLYGAARRRRRRQSGRRMVDRCGARQEPHAALLRQSVARGDPRRRRRPGRGLPPRIRRARPHRQRAAAGAGVTPTALIAD